MSELKENLRRHLSQTVAEIDLKRWFDPLELLAAPDSREIRVVFPHGYFGQWFQVNARDVFEKQAGLFLGHGFVLRYGLPDGQDSGPAAAVPRLAASNIDFPFGHLCTFEQFFTNQKNLLPLASARQIATSGEVKYNPFIIQGEAGSGKTMLMRCMANEVSKRLDRNLIFLGGVEELSALDNPARPQASPSAFPRLPSLRCIFLDDAQRLGDHPQLADELIRVLDNFQDSQRQVVLARSHQDDAWRALPEALRSRLEAGLLVQLSRPDLDVRMKFVQENCHRKKIGLTKSQMLTLAQRHQEFRSLSGMLNKLQAYRELLKRDISESVFENILGQGSEPTQPALTPQDIFQAVSERFGVDPSELLASKRTKPVVQARQVAMLLCREELGLSFPALGRLFGGKDHSTVLYSINKIQKLQHDDAVLKETVSQLRKTCRQGS